MRNGIDGPTLLELTEDELDTQLSIRNPIHRKKIVAHAKLLAAAATPSPRISPRISPRSSSAPTSPQLSSPGSRGRVTRADGAPRRGARAGDVTARALQNARLSSSEGSDYEEVAGVLARTRSCEPSFNQGFSSANDKEPLHQGYGTFSKARAAARRRQSQNRGGTTQAVSAGGSTVSGSPLPSPRDRRSGASTAQGSPLQSPRDLRGGGSQVPGSPLQRSISRSSTGSKDSLVGPFVAHHVGITRENNQSVKSSAGRKGVLLSNVPPASTGGRRAFGFGELSPSCSTKGSWGSPRTRQPLAGSAYVACDHSQFIPHSDTNPMTSHYYKDSMQTAPQYTAINRADRKSFDLPWQRATMRTAKQVPGPGIYQTSMAKDHLGGAMEKGDRFNYNRKAGLNWLKEMKSDSTVL